MIRIFPSLVSQKRWWRKRLDNKVLQAVPSVARGTVNILFSLVLKTLESAPWVPTGSMVLVFPALAVVLGESVRTVSSFCHLLTFQAVPTSPLGGNLSSGGE